MTSQQIRSRSTNSIGRLTEGFYDTKGFYDTASLGSQQASQHKTVYQKNITLPKRMSTAWQTNTLHRSVQLRKRSDRPTTKPWPCLKIMLSDRCNSRKLPGGRDDRFRIRQSINEVVFCCVDSISNRSVIWNHLQNRAEFWADAQMLGEVMRVLTATDVDLRMAYGQTLFDQSEAQVRPRTSRSTTYTANILAALMVHQFTRWIRGLPFDREVSLNLLTNELVVS